MPHHLFRIPPDDLNRRELEVCGLLADGKSTNEIAALLRLSHHTVRQYIMRAVEKVGVADRYALIGWVRRERAALHERHASRLERAVEKARERST